MKPIQKFTSPRRDFPSNGSVYHDGSRGKTVELQKPSLSISDEPIPFQRSWRKPVTSSESAGQSSQALRHAGAIPKRRENSKVTANTHQAQGKGNGSKQHARRRIPGISNDREESKQRVVKAKPTNEQLASESAKSDTQSHSGLKKITRKYFRQHKASRDRKTSQPESQDDRPNNVNEVQRLQVDSIEGDETHCDEVQSSSLPAPLGNASSADGSIRTEPPALRDAAVNSLDGEDSCSLAESNQPNHRSNFSSTQIQEHSSEEDNTEGFSTLERSHSLIDECLPSSVSNDRIPNSSIRSLRRSPRAPERSGGSIDTLEANREQGSGTLGGSFRRDASSLSNSLETFTSSNMASPDSDSTASRTLPTLSDLRQRNLNLPNFRTSNQSSTPVHQQSYERLQGDLGQRLETGSPSLFGTRGETNLENSSDEFDQDRLDFDRRFQTPELRRNPSSFLDRSRGLNSRQNLSTFSSTSSRGRYNMNANFFSEQNHLSNTSEDREPDRMRNTSPVESEQPARLLSRQTERESYTSFRNRQIQRDRERVRHRLVNPSSSFNQDELFLLSSDSLRPSVSRMSSTRLPSLSTSSQSEDATDQPSMGESLLGATRPLETPPPSPTPGSFRSRDDRERVANHLAVMACPLFAPLLFELPPAIMIQMLASARQELGDEFVQLLIENVVLSLLAQQMHDAGLTSDAGDLNRPPPATKEVIQSLTKKEISAEMKGKECKCAICHVEYELEETVTELRCGHFFHGACISIWLDKTATCPVCRYQLQEL